MLMRLIVCIVVCLGAAGIGSLLTTPSLRPWYEGLSKPRWNPPNWLFGPVWTILYVAMAIAAWLVWRKVGLTAAPMQLFLTAIVAQCCMVRTILSAKVTGPGLWRNCRFVVCHPGDNDRILECGSSRRLVALAIFNLGWLRDSTQLFNLAVERLTMFAPTKGIPN